MAIDNDQRVTQIVKIPVSAVRPNPQQPRRTFDKQALEELAQSIAQHGLLQPIEVEPGPAGTFILHHGERRWRAHKIAGLSTISAVIADPLENRDRLIRAVIENVQREDMNPIEEAEAYRLLLDEGMNIAAISRTTGRAYATIQARLAWLEFPEDIQDLVASGDLFSDRRVSEALAKLPDEARVEMASKLAGQNIAAIQKAVNVYLQLSEEKRPKRPYYNCPDERPATAGTRAHALTLVVGNCPVPGPEGELFEEAMQVTCRDCALFEYEPSLACQSCPATVFVGEYVDRIDPERRACSGNDGN